MSIDERDPDRTELLETRAPGAADGGEGLARGTRLGRYRVEALLGRGGMGEVYRAEQLEPVRRTVALKLLRGRTLDPRRKAHFEIERQVLAQMRHPSIAQIHDADTTADGHPFFAMEFIDGQPIVGYCEQHALPLDRRLELFIQVCEGVQHAHQKGVIHRDLKPGNLLVDEVDGRPRPKIIDFGIATASSLSGAHEIAGTPDYMSPEQAAGDPALLDTRSDVYSLGVVLSELLTGQRPTVAGETVTDRARSLRLPSAQLDTLGPDEAARVAQARGQRLRTMRRVLRGELDWVVARAMAHDRADRYPSAAALAEDLRRFLAGRPVQAVPASRLYAWRKFALRHRAGMAAAAIALAALLGGLALSLHGLLQARAQRAIAEQRSAELEKVVAFQQSTLEDIDPEAMGRGLDEALRAQATHLEGAEADAFSREIDRTSTTDIARQLLDANVLASAEHALERDFAGEPGLAADLRASVARVRLALGLYPGAAEGFAQVAGYRAAVLGPGHRRTLEAVEGQALSLLRAGRAEQVRALLPPLLPLVADWPATDPLRVRLELADSEAHAALGERERALELQRPLLQRVEAALGPRDPLTLRVRTNLAINEGATGHPERAVAQFRQVLALQRELHGEDHDETRRAMGNLAAFHADAGDFEAASALNRRLVALNTRLLGASHPVTLSNRSNLATDLSDLGRLDEAWPEMTAVVEARTRVLGPDHPQTLRSRIAQASLLAKMGRHAEAEAAFRAVLADRTRVLGADHPDTLTAVLRLAELVAARGRTDQALAMLDALRVRAQGAGPAGERFVEQAAGMAASLRAPPGADAAR
ncbi:serine/threonine-protein kinase [Luteimonas kalidii]|uniref:Serine/threonine-protein kinase n=1 Tax=Luteimonas kalidii TaxID=3042025 RepID=A0ABT6JUG3_9GAMM|nr:serine/threonine-protein kinase [Luteimonas kalidii]MDH5834118.1 serine/threonine-protein kinase [Luteimonas kalidii]